MVSLITHSGRAVGVRGCLQTGHVCPDSHTAIEMASVCWFSNRRTKAVHSILSAFFQARFVGWPAKVDHSLIRDRSGGARNEHLTISKRATLKARSPRSLAI